MSDAEEPTLAEQIAHLKRLYDPRSGRFALDRAILRSLERLQDIEREHRTASIDAQDLLAIRCALRDMPALPNPRVLRLLRIAASFHDDWPRGKEMQRELGRDAIPAVTECEMGAGFWDRITRGAWRP